MLMHERSCIWKNYSNLHAYSWAFFLKAYGLRMNVYRYLLGKWNTSEDPLNKMWKVKEFLLQNQVNKQLGNSFKLLINQKIKLIKLVNH